MNTADYCARARELYGEYLMWKAYGWDGYAKVQQQIIRSYRAWQEHIKDCYECGGSDE